MPITSWKGRGKQTNKQKKNSVCHPPSQKIYFFLNTRTCHCQLQLRQTMFRYCKHHLEQIKVCIVCFEPCGPPRNAPITDGGSVRTFVSRPVLCCQQWREGVGLIRRDKLLQYTQHGAWRKSVLALRREKKQGDWQTAKSAYKTQVWRQQEWKRVSGEELGRAVLSQGLNSLPL